VLAVSQEFEVNTHRVKTMKLLNLRQTGIVEEYKLQFDQLVYHILLYNHSLSETMLVSQFLLGLKEDLRHVVEMHLPNSVSQAAILAYVQEHLTEKSKLVPKKFQAHKGDDKSAMHSSELWKAGQLKEYRRANNLCFKCGGKYTPAHTCVNPTTAIHLMEQNFVDGGTFLSDDILKVLDNLNSI
jgi:hypothetical protein